MRRWTPRAVIAGAVVKYRSKHGTARLQKHAFVNSLLNEVLDVLQRPAVTLTGRQLPFRRLSNPESNYLAIDP